MNPQLFNRIRAGSFAKVVIKGQAELSGYIAEDPSDSNFLRMDGMILNPQGYLEQISIQLSTNDIETVHFLAESPQFMDQEGNVLTMEEGFLKNLD